jgi:ketosteroid isomerase-like protein
MNRRSMLIVTTAGVAFAAGNAVAQQPSDIDGVKAASKAFYAALAVIDNGEAMEKVWAPRPYITFVGPRSKSIIIGMDALKKYWPEANKLFTERKISLTEQHIHVIGNFAWEMGNEVGEPKLRDGSVRKTDNFVTGVYEKIDGRWLKVSHHAQPRPQ